MSLNPLLNRRSIRKYTSEKIDESTLYRILNDVLRAPTSMNMQSVRFVVVASDEAKARLKPVLIGNELQLETSAAMIVIFSDLNKFDRAKDIYAKAVAENKMPESVMIEKLAQFEKMVPLLPKEKLLRDGYIDGGIVSAHVMSIAKDYGYDTCAIGGFDASKINEALSIESSLFPVLILSIGKKDETGYESVRLDAKEVTRIL